MRSSTRSSATRPSFVRLEEVFAEDLKYSRKIEWHRWRRRGFFNQLLEVLSLPVREQL
jgi:hypothetical protein